MGPPTGAAADAGSGPADGARSRDPPRSPLPATPAPAADQHGGPAPRRPGGDALGLRPHSTHSPEDASVSSSRSGVGSLSEDSKPPSQKSAGIGLVRRLRRLSSAALHGKVNRLFARPANPSQDSLPAGRVPGVPDSPPALHSSAASIGSPHSQASSSASLSGAGWRTSNAPSLPPLPPQLLSSRRNRALTEITPLAIRGRMELAASGRPVPTPTSTPTPGSHDSAPPSATASRSRATNSPLVASPLSRKSFHALSAASSRDNIHGSGRTAPAAEPLPASATPAPATPRPRSGRIKSPKLIRSSSHAPGPRDSDVFDRHDDAPVRSDGSPRRPSMARQLSYQAPQTPSPPERTAGRSQAHFSVRAVSPTMARRRTALATLGRPADKDGSPSPEGDDRPAPPSLLSRHNSGTPSSSGAESPSSLLSAFRLRSRVSSGLFHQPSTGASARSSMSITSDSMQSWTSAVSDNDRDDDGDGRKGPGHNSLSLAAYECRHRHQDQDQDEDQLTPATRLRDFFYPSILSWQFSHDGEAPPQSHSPTLTAAYDLGDAPATALQSSGARDQRLTAAAAAATTGPSAERPPAEPVRPATQAVRPRGGSQPVHLARAATANAIRLKDRGPASVGDAVAGPLVPPLRRVSATHVGPGSAPESLGLDSAMERGKARLRLRATSASNQPVAVGDSAGASSGQHGTFGRGTAAGGAPSSRPPSSMSAYTMSPISSSGGEEGHATTPHAWPSAAGLRTTPERGGEAHLGGAGPNTPSSTSSPPPHLPHYHSSHHSGHQLRLNTSSVQRSASGHSVSSGISELLEPSSVSLARKDALWQVLVVSKSRADTEIDKLMRQWKETDSGTIVCTQDTDAKPSVGDDDAIILKVKRGHRRSTSDMKRADGDRNEFRRRVVDLACLIRGSSVSELSNEGVTRGITEQLYGLLTEQRTRHPSDANIGALILDVLYQFSAVSQTVSQLAIPPPAFAGARSGVSGEASPAASQVSSPRLAPEHALGRGMAGALPPMASALAPQSDAHPPLAGTPQSSIGRAQSVNSTTMSDVASELNEYRIVRTASDGPPGPQLQRVPQVSSPHLLPASVHGSATSLPALLAPVHGSRFGMASGLTPTSIFSLGGLYMRQRHYLPPAGMLLSSSVSIDTPDAETDVSSRPSLDDANVRPTLSRQLSQLSMSSDAADSTPFSRGRAARPSIQAQTYYAPTERGREVATAAGPPRRFPRPATMYIAHSGVSAPRRASSTTSRQERLARLLGDSADLSDSAPMSPMDTPVDTPAKSYFEPGSGAALRPRPVGPAPISEAKPARTVARQEHRPAALEPRASSVPTPTVDELAGARPLPRSVAPSVIPEEADGEVFRQVSKQTVRSDEAPPVGAPEAADSAEASEPAARGSKDGSPGTARPVSVAGKTAGSEVVVCRLCERSFFREELSAHSDVCILEQTRALKLDEANQRMKRLRDSVTRRLADLKRARSWDKAAAHEAERLGRIADRAIFWPEGDGQRELIVAKAKFAKYVEKLQSMVGIGPDSSRTADAHWLPRADVETLWLARRLLDWIQEKSEIIEEFDKEFSRLERQEALMREAEAAEASSPPLLALPTWAQLAQCDHRSPAASERMSMELAQSQSESGSATPDVATPLALGAAKPAAMPSRQHSRHGRVSRHSTSRRTKAGSDTADGDGAGSSSRKLVSLFAALFRNNHSGLGRHHRDGSVFWRRASPAPLAPGPLPTPSRSSSVIYRATHGPATPGTPGTLATLVPAAPAAGGPGAAGEGADAADRAQLAASDAALRSPLTRQRNNSQASALRGAADTTPKAQRMPQIDDFDFVKPISRGAFGRVYLTRKKATKDLYAIKVMRKKDMINKNMVAQALAERRALSLLSTEWVVQLYYAFHSSKHLFLVMEYLVGGDLAGLLHVWGVMDEDAARFYIGEIACAIDYLHRNSIVHRDIKPDNVILASDGHIKLTDFGLSQVAVRSAPDARALEGTDGSAGTPESPASDAAQPGGVSTKAEEYWTAALAMSGQGRAPAAAGPPAAKALPLSKRAHVRKSSRGLLGTPDYLAPELLLGAGNGLAVDWWALGVCLFEFLCGYPPFMDETPEAIFRNILSHAIDWPDEEGFISTEAAELINALLRPEPATRAHWKDIQSSRLFSDWDLATVRQRAPPFVPQPDDEVDTSYFEACQRKEPHRLSNATFLQAEAPPRSLQPPLPPAQHLSQHLEDSAVVPPASPMLPLTPQRESHGGSMRGSRRGSQRGPRLHRSVSGSVSASMSAGAGEASTHTSIGQLKMLFNDMAMAGGGGSRTTEQAPEMGADGSTAQDLACAAASTASGETTDSFLAADSDSRRESTGSGPGEHVSIDSLSDTDPDSDADRPATRLPLPLRIPTSAGNPAQAALPMPASPLAAQQLASHARRAVSRSPGQSPGAAADAGAAGLPSMAHSRCASVSMALAPGRKSGPGARTRRPSEGGDAAPVPETAATHLLRTSSTDERLQTSVGAPCPTPGPGDTGTAHNSEPENEADDGSGDGDGARDNDVDAAERVFEDFAYKNLALLSHVNRGVSSSGSGSPMPDPGTTPAPRDVHNSL